MVAVTVSDGQNNAKKYLIVSVNKRRGDNNNVLYKRKNRDHINLKTSIQMF